MGEDQVNVTVLLSSGDTDEWENISETLEDSGQLILLSNIDDDEVPDGIKTVVMSQEVDQGPDLPPMTKTQTFQVVVIYATGMWMKVEYA